MENETPELLTPAEVCHRLRVSRTSLWRMTKAHTFPTPICIGSRRFWTPRDVAGYLAARDAERQENGQS